MFYDSFSILENFERVTELFASNKYSLSKINLFLSFAARNILMQIHKCFRFHLNTSIYVSQNGIRYQLHLRLFKEYALFDILSTFRSVNTLSFVTIHQGYGCKSNAHFQIYVTFIGQGLYFLSMLILITRLVKLLRIYKFIRRSSFHVLLNNLSDLRKKRSVKTNLQIDSK